MRRARSTWKRRGDGMPISAAIPSAEARLTVVADRHYMKDLARTWDFAIVCAHGSTSQTISGSNRFQASATAAELHRHQTGCICRA